MRGSVVKRTTSKGNVGYFVVVEERTPEGKRRRRWHSDPTTGSAFTNRRAADAHAAALISDLSRGAYTPPTSETVNSWFDTWLRIVRPNLRASTYASYERVLRVHVRPVIGTLPLRRLSTADLDRMYAAMLENGRADHRAGEPLSARTVRYCSTIVSKALKDAVRKGLIPKSPADAADSPKPASTGHGALKAWSANELHAFLAGTSEHPCGRLWAFLAATGCRRGEGLGLRWQDVDFNHRRVSIVRSVQKIAGKVIFDSVKTTSSRRAVAVDEATLELLRDERKQQSADQLRVGSLWVDHGLVFAGPTGEPRYPETVSRAFRAETQRLGLPHIPLHGLRHTWATLALSAGVHPKVVQERLGHANVGITLNIYSHVAPVMHDDAAEAVARLVRGSGG